MSSFHEVPPMNDPKLLAFVEAARATFQTMLGIDAKPGPFERGHLELRGRRVDESDDRPSAGHDDARRTRVETTRADVEVLVVEGDADLRGCGGRLPLARVRLHEHVGGRRRLPHRFVEHAVDGDGRGGAGRRQRAAAVTRCHRQRLPRSDRGGQKHAACYP